MKERQQVEHEERLRQVPVAVAEIVLQVVALVFERVERLILDLPARPPGAHQLGDVLSVVGTRSVTQALRYFTSPCLMIRNWMKLMSGESGLPFRRQTGDPLVLAAFAAVDGMVAVQQVAAAQAVDILARGVSRGQHRWSTASAFGVLGDPGRVPSGTPVVVVGKRVAPAKPGTAGRASWVASY